MFLDTSKETKDRYLRKSINWGTVAVNPADLVQAYGELSTERQNHVTHMEGSYRSRTTALAHAREAVAGLLANGYKKGEVAAILATLASQ